MKGRVYKLYSNLGPEIYIGSTTLPLKKRLQLHKSETKRFIEGKIPNKCISSDIIRKYDKAVKIELIKEYNVVDTLHLKVYEQLCINKMNPINIKSAFNIIRLVNKNYYDEHRDRILELKRIKYHQNKQISSAFSALCTIEI
jgi:predicted GIY-YIG superfamily endonuclease